MKKSIAILLSLCLLLPCAVILANAVPVQPACIVTGSVPELFGTVWDNSNTDNTMEYTSDHTYSKTYTADAVYSIVEVRVYDQNDGEWYGDASGNALTFSVEAPGDFTISYNSLTKVASVSGDNIYDGNDPHDYEPFYVFGNGDEGWLNNAAGNAISEDNLMEEAADYIYYLRTDASEGNGREFRISYCGSMDFTFGGTFEGYDVWTDADFAGDPVSLDLGEDVGELCIFLDMRDFDFATKEGARFAVVELKDGESFRLPKDTYKNEFYKQYKDYYDETSGADFYEELYSHTAKEGIDWVLVTASAGGEEQEWIIYCELGDRIINRFSGGSPFEFDYAVYNTRRNRFVSLEHAYESGNYPGLDEALADLNIGRLRGDIDGDGVLTVSDATEMQRCLAEYRSYPQDDQVDGLKLPSGSLDDNDQPCFISDINRDGVRNVIDVTAIQRKLAGFD